MRVPAAGIPAKRVGGRVSTMVTTSANGSLADEQMVSFIKVGQKNSPEFKEMWKAHCDSCGGGTKDPSKHDTTFFTGFLFRFGMKELGAQDWALPHLQGVSSIVSPVIVQAIKKGQREDPEWKAAWQTFVAEESSARGTLDPSRQDAGSLLQFMEDVGIQNFADKSWMAPFVMGTELERAE